MTYKIYNSDADDQLAHVQRRLDDIEALMRSLASGIEGKIAASSTIALIAAGRTEPEVPPPPDDVVATIRKAATRPGGSFVTVVVYGRKVTSRVHPGSDPEDWWCGLHHRVTHFGTKARNLRQFQRKGADEQGT